MQAERVVVRCAVVVGNGKRSSLEIRPAPNPRREARHQPHPQGAHASETCARAPPALLVAPPVALPPVMPAAPGYTIDRSVSTGNGHRWTVPASRLSAANIPYEPGHGWVFLPARAAWDQDGSKRQGTLSGCFVKSQKPCSPRSATRSALAPRSWPTTPC